MAKNREMKLRALFEEYRNIFYSIPGIVNVSFHTDKEMSIAHLANGEIKPLEDGFIIWVENKEVKQKLERLFRDVDNVRITIKEIIRP